MPEKLQTLGQSYPLKQTTPQCQTGKTAMEFEKEFCPSMIYSKKQWISSKEWTISYYTCFNGTTLAIESDTPFLEIEEKDLIQMFKKKWNNYLQL